MKKKKKSVKRKPKIDVALESLLNLERVSKEVLKKLATLEQNIYPLLNDQHPKNNTEPYKQYQPKPNESSFKDIPMMWNNNSGYWNAVENGLQ